MQIEIKKYKYRTSTNNIAGSLRNYFENPTYVDKIIFNEIYDEGFPIFNEEWNDEYDDFELRAGDFDLVFSLLQNVTSSNGKTIENFFSEDINNHCLVAKITLDSKIFGGLIDISSIKFNYTFIENRYDIQFTVFSFTKEFATFTNHKPPRPALLINSINDYFWFGWRKETNELLPSYFYVDTSRLNWIAKCGYEPVLITPLWQRIFDEGRANECTSWGLFEDLCKAFGIIYKFDFYHHNYFGEYISIVLKLAFRDEGFSDSNLSVNLMTHEEGFKLYRQSKRWQIFKTMKTASITTGEPEGDEIFYGTIFDAEKMHTCDGHIGETMNFTEEHFRNQNGVLLAIGFPPPYETKYIEDCNIIEFNYYFNTMFYETNYRRHYLITEYSQGKVDHFFANTVNDRLFPKVVSFPRMWTHPVYTIESWQQGLFGGYRLSFVGVRNTSHDIHNWWYKLEEQRLRKSYEHLINSLKKTLNAKISLINSYNINLFDKTIIGNYEYQLQRLRNLDLNNNEVDTEWLELRKITSKENVS